MRCARVLAPVDFSDDSIAAARLAAALTRRDAGALTLLLVDLLPEVGERLAQRAPADVFESYLSDRVETLKHTLDELARTLGDGAVTTAVARDDVATAIVERAARDGADLVVLGAHRAGSPLDLVVGNVALAVAARAPCPVLIAHAHAAEAAVGSPFARPLVVASIHPGVGRAVALARALSAPRAPITVVFVEDERPVGAPVDDDRVRDDFELAAAPLRAEGASATLLWSDGADVLALLLERVERARHDLVIVERRRAAPLPRRAGTTAPPASAAGALSALARKLLDRAPVPVAVIADG